MRSPFSNYEIAFLGVPNELCELLPTARRTRRFRRLPNRASKSRFSNLKAERYCHLREWSQRSEVSGLNGVPRAGRRSTTTILQHLEPAPIRRTASKSMLRTRLTRFACCVRTRARRVILLGKLGLQLGSQLIKPIYEHAVNPTAPPSIPLGH